jgi:3-oxoacyl-[acyl-carrier-protein] synthase II
MVSALGVGREPFFRALTDEASLVKNIGRSSGAPITSFDASAYAGAVVREVPDFDASRYLGEKGLRTLDRLTKLLLVAAKLAMHDGGLKKDGVFVQSSPERVGVVCSNAYGSLEAIAELDRVAVLEDARYINPAKFPNTVSNSASGYVSIWEDLQALNVTVSDGNCGALDAVACADIYLETERADVLLVGGAEALSEGLYMAFRRLGALEGGALGEGAVLFVMEPVDHAASRGATWGAEVVGYGTAFVPPAGEASLFHASGDAMERAIANALADAEIDAKRIDVVASSVSGIHAFDSEEVSAIQKVLGRDVAISAPKAIFGETLGAGGAMAMAAALAWMHGARPTPLVHGTPPEDIETVLVTSMGFYGNASAVVMRRPAATPARAA